MTPVRTIGGCFATAAALLASSAAAIDMPQVWNGSLDQPRVNILIRVDGETDPLDGNTLDPFTLESETTWNIEGFFDTGASAILIAPSIAAPSEFDIPLEDGWIFEDVGVASTPTPFHITQLLDIRVADSDLVTPFDEPPNPGAVNDQANNDYFDARYPHSYDNMRAIIGPINHNTPVIEDPIDQLLNQTSEVNVFGMPLFKDKIAVFDGRAINTYVLSGGELDLENTESFPFLRTHLYDAGSGHPDIPSTELHIATSYADFSRFVNIEGDGVQMPSFSHNPFVGANPINLLTGTPDNTPGVQFGREGYDDVNGNLLFDTGAAATIIGTHIAEGLGVRYALGLEPSGTNDAPRLQSFDEDLNEWVNMTDDEQFELTIGGIDGTLKIAGFFVEEFTVPTIEGEPLVYTDVPVLVFDISITEIVPQDGVDPSEWEPTTITLDGLFGMNLLFGSIFVDEPYDIFSLLGAPQNPGAFDYVTFDEQTGEIGLSFDQRVIPEPATGALLVAAGAMLLMRRRAI